MTLKNKRERIDIRSLNDFINIINMKNYIIDDIKEENFKAEIIKIFYINKDLAQKIYMSIKDGNINYRAKDINEFIDYIEKIMLFEKEHYKLCKKINEFKKINIERVEYERVVSAQDDVDHIIKAIDEIRDSISGSISEDEILRIELLENEISNDYLYAKDIELLKKMLLNSSQYVVEAYDIKTKVKTISIEVPKEIDKNYINLQKGTIEYYQHLKSNIPRIRRLIKNINKYIKPHDYEEGTFKINQSEALQDSINIAVATFDNKEFKAISGSDEVEGYCFAKPIEETSFKSCKVNKLGKLGIGYNRVNDSEKKILEEINKQIEAKELSDRGTLILYSKWQPCPSCYYVISQFCKRYPYINLKVRYRNKYGE